MARATYIIFMLFLTSGFNLVLAMHKQNQEEISVGLSVLLDPCRVEGENFDNYYEGTVLKEVSENKDGVKRWKVKWLRQAGRVIDPINEEYDAHDLVPLVHRYGNYVVGKKVIYKNESNKIVKVKNIFKNGIIRVSNYVYLDVNTNANISPEVDSLDQLNKNGKFRIIGHQKTHKAGTIFENGQIQYEYFDWVDACYVSRLTCMDTISVAHKPRLKQAQNKDITAESETLVSLTERSVLENNLQK